MTTVRRSVTSKKRKKSATPKKPPASRKPEPLLQSMARTIGHAAGALTNATHQLAEQISSLPARASVVVKKEVKKKTASKKKAQKKKKTQGARSKRSK